MKKETGIFSADTANKIAKQGKNVFLVTGKRAMAEIGYLQKMYSFLRFHGCAVYIYDKIPSEPNDEIVAAGSKKFLENNCNVIVALGGGSVIDAAKAISILAANGGRIYDYKDISKFDKRPFPIIAIPTTCGSGSEVTKYAVINNREPREKFTIKSNEIIPKDFILDETVLRYLPEIELIASAFDASTHLAEPLLLNIKSAETSEEMCLDGLKKIFLSIKSAIKNKDIRHLKNLMNAAHLGGVVINKERTGLPHTMGNKISGYKKIKHGLINAVILQEVLEYLERKKGSDAVFERRLRKFEQLLKDSGLFKGTVSESLRDFYNSFRVNLKFFKENEIFDGQIKKEIIRQTCNDKELFNITPKKLTVEDIGKILENALVGMKI